MLGFARIMFCTARFSKLWPVTGYVNSSSYSPFLSSVATQDRASTRVPMPRVAKEEEEEEKRMGVISNTTSARLQQM